MDTLTIKNLKKKKYSHFSFLPLFFLFLMSISAYSQNTECFNSTITYHNKDYPAQFFESSTVIDDSSDFAKYKSGYFKVDTNCIIQYIDLKHLHDMVKKNKKNVLIFFWSSFDGDTINFPEVYKLRKVKNLQTYIISCDICTDNQISLLRRYLTAKGYLDTSYIIYQNYNSQVDIINEFKSFNKLTSFINSIDTAYYNVIDKANKSFHIPYAVLINKNNQIIYRNKNINISEITKLINNQKQSETKVFGTAFAGISKNQKAKEENSSKSLVFSGRNDAYQAMDIKIPDTACKTTAISPNYLNKILNDYKGSKVLIHIWGLWCQYTSLGILDIKQLIPSKNDKYKLLLINADMETEGQIELVRKFLFNNGINVPIYFIKNKFNSAADIPKFATFKHLIDFAQVFDKDYHNIAIPYTVILDENGKIIYKKANEIPSQDLIPTDPEEEKKEIEGIKNEFYHMEIEKIKAILEK